MTEFPTDIYTEPVVDVDTLANLGPLRAMAGIWRGVTGLDVKPKADGPREQAYVERMELQPIDPQTNGPQLFYGLRYSIHITKPAQVKTYHEQVGYWLWEPATGDVVHSLTIPRGLIAMAGGNTTADAKTFTLTARNGDPHYGICDVPFLTYAFRTSEFSITVTYNDDGTWTYHETTVLQIHGGDQAFRHTDTNTVTKIGEPTPNPLAR